MDFYKMEYLVTKHLCGWLKNIVSNTQTNVKETSYKIDNNEMMENVFVNKIILKCDARMANHVKMIFSLINNVIKFKK